VRDFPSAIRQTLWPTDILALANAPKHPRDQSMKVARYDSAEPCGLVRATTISFQQDVIRFRENEDRVVPILGFRESSVNYELAFFDSDLGIEFAVYYENRNLHLPPIFSRVEIEVLAIRFNHCRRRILPSRRNSCAEEPLLSLRRLGIPRQLNPWSVLQHGLVR